MDEYYEEDYDLDIVDVREDFEYIWSKNIVQVDLIREQNPQAGDYFREGDDPGIIRRKVWLNIQGVSSNDYKRIQAGIITPDSLIHAYAKWDDDIQDLDVVKVGDWYYRIKSFNKSQYAGQLAFQDFDLTRQDKDT